jgi:hypothetical protein
MMAIIPYYRHNALWQDLTAAGKDKHDPLQPVITGAELF